MKIDWKLKNGEEVIINEIDKAAKYEDNIIYYVDEYGTHVIDRNNRIYERRCPEDIFRVDFNNNLCYNYIRKINEKSIVGEGSIIGIFYCQKL